MHSVILNDKLGFVGSGTPLNHISGGLPAIKTPIVVVNLPFFALIQIHTKTKNIAESLLRKLLRKTSS